MANDSYQRKLTSILYADIAGYSRLTGEDEEGTHHRVMQVLDHASGQIRADGGTVLRYAGDAILAEFPSVVAAVNSAVAIQIELDSQNQSIEDQRKVRIRIGINIGDVIVDRGEVYGDGVNLAARLEASAPEGGICISASVYEQIHGKQDAIFAEGGEMLLKNIDRPVQVFFWQPNQEMQGKGKPADTSIGKKPASPARWITVAVFGSLLLALSVALVAYRLPGSAESSSEMSATQTRPTIAVLPFLNMSSIAENAHFAGGVQEDVLTNLANADGLLVISRTSVMKYLSGEVTLQEIGIELGARYIVEGSVRRYGDHVRVTVQLIDAQTDTHLWSSNFDRELTNVFDVQDEVAESISLSIVKVLNPAAVTRKDNLPTTSVKAYDLYTKALEIERTQGWGKKEIAEMLDLLEEAVVEDSDYAEAWAKISILASIIWHKDYDMTELFPSGELDKRQLLDKYKALSRQALIKTKNLGPDKEETLLARAFFPTTADDADHAQKGELVEKGITQYPKNPWFYSNEAWWHLYNGSGLSVAAESIDKSLAVDPLNIAVLEEAITFYRSIADFEKVELLSKRLEQAAPGSSDRIEDNLAMNYILRLAMNEFYTTADEEILKTALKFLEENKLSLKNGAHTGYVYESFYISFSMFLGHYENVINLPVKINLEKITNGLEYNSVIRALNEKRFVSEHLDRAPDHQAGINNGVLKVIAHFRETRPTWANDFHSLWSESEALKGLGRHEEASSVLDRYLREMALEDGYDFGLLLASTLTGNIDRAVELFLERFATKEHPAVDGIAAECLLWQDLHTHPKVIEYYVTDGKWLPYLASCLPAYAKHLN